MKRYSPSPARGGGQGGGSKSVESLQDRGQGLYQCFGDLIDDQLHMPDSLTRVGAQGLRDLIRAPFEWRRLLCGITLAAANGAGQANQNGDRALHFGWLAPGRGAGGVHFLPQRRDAFGSVPRPAIPGIPAVNVGHGQRQHPLPNRPDHQWRSAGTWARHQLAIARRVELASEVDFALPQERSNDGEGFGESRHAAVEGKAISAIFS